jgi:hypothetical protein
MLRNWQMLCMLQPAATTPLHQRRLVVSTERKQWHPKHTL